MKIVNKITWKVIHPPPALACMRCGEPADYNVQIGEEPAPWNMVACGKCAAMDETELMKTIK
jgi:hypothetical protein